MNNRNVNSRSMFFANFTNPFAFATMLQYCRQGIGV